MKPPPKEWFEPKKVSENPPDPPEVQPREKRSSPDWLQLLEVYAFLFEAHETVKVTYK